MTSDFPTPPFPDMIGTTCLNRACRAKSPGARRCGTRSSLLIVGTRPGEPRLRQRGDDRLGPQTVRGSPFADRLVLVDPAARAVQAEPLEHVDRDGQRGDELADIGLGGDLNGG